MAPRYFYGWNVLAATFVMAMFSFGLGFYGLTVYLAVLQRLHGWSGSAVSVPVTVYYVSGALLSAVIGDLYQRLGAGTVVAGGSVAMAGGLAMLGCVTQPWQLYPVFLVMSLGWGAMSGAAINIVLAPWWERRRGFVVSLAFNGAALGGVIITPALIPLIDALGFTRALASAALVLLVVMLALAGGVMRRGPEERAPSCGGATRYARGGSGACPRPSRSASRPRSACSRIWWRSRCRRSARAAPCGP